MTHHAAFPALWWHPRSSFSEFHLQLLPLVLAEIRIWSCRSTAMIVRNCWHWSFFFTSDTAQSQIHLPWPKCYKHTLQAQGCGYGEKCKHFSTSNILKLLLQEKRGFKNLPGFSPLLLTALLGNCSVQRGRDFHWKPRDIPTIPSLLNPSYWSQVQSRTLKPFNPTVRCPQFLVCPGVTAWGGSGCSGVSGGGSAFLVCAPGSHSSGNARSRRWFPRSVSCVSKNHLITWMKTNTILNSECLMLRATINAIN